jgi:predicted RNase H-like nuclease (RuvC/YqgF family)
VSNQFDSDSQEDVVIIEQRDKHTLVYIGIAAVLGLAIGGLMGSIVTENKWQPAYEILDNKLQQARVTQTEAIQKRQQELDERAANLENEVAQKVSQQVDEVTIDSKKNVADTLDVVTELEKVNLDLEAQVQNQSDKIASQEETLSNLERQIAMQANIFERSRELFQRELLIKQDLSKLQSERETLEPRLRRYKKECDVYLDGTSFDANSSACDKHDEVNSNISQIDQMIEVHKLDLREIESIANSIGL